MDFIPINIPLLGEAEKRKVQAVLDSGMLTDSSYEGGAMVRELESKVAKLLKAKHVIAVSSGTAALHSALLALGIKERDEVIVPSFTFVATANVVLACGAKPVFVDNREDYNIDAGKLEKAITKRTKAVIPVHVFGYPADMDEVNEVASKHQIRVVEDAAESLGAEYKGRQTGTLSDIGCFSLYATKVVTSGEGGALATDDDEFADHLRLVRNHGEVSHNYSKCLGLNYRLPEVMAAIGSAQMDRFGGFIRKRTRNARYLDERLGGVEGAAFTQTAADRTHVYYLYTLYLRKNRDKILQRLRDRGVGAAVYFKTPVHKAPLYAEMSQTTRRLPVAERDAAHVLSLPVHPGVSQEGMERVADGFIQAAELLK